MINPQPEVHRLLIDLQHTLRELQGLQINTPAFASACVALSRANGALTQLDLSLIADSTGSEHEFGPEETHSMNVEPGLDPESIAGTMD